MKISTAVVITDVTGAPLRDENQQEFGTLRRAIQTVCLNSLPGEELSGEEKQRLWKIAIEANQDEVEWSPETVALLRERIGKGYGAAVVGPAWAALDA